MLNNMNNKLIASTFAVTNICLYATVDAQAEKPKNELPPPSVLSQLQVRQLPSHLQLPYMPLPPVKTIYLQGIEYLRANMGPAYRQSFFVICIPEQLIGWYSTALKNNGWTIEQSQKSFLSAARDGNTLNIQVDGSDPRGCRMAVFYSCSRANTTM